MRESRFKSISSAFPIKHVTRFPYSPFLTSAGLKPETPTPATMGSKLASHFLQCCQSWLSMNGVLSPPAKCTQCPQSKLCWLVIFLAGFGGLCQSMNAGKLTEILNSFKYSDELPKKWLSHICFWRCYFGIQIWTLWKGSHWLIYIHSYQSTRVPPLPNLFPN